MTPFLESTPWITCPQANAHAQMRLFCLPYAGGGTSIFRPWSERLSIAEVCPIQLPGREQRIAEPPFSCLDRLIAALTPVVLPYLDQPFALFGHSMGGLIAFELARSLRHYQVQPMHLFISGCRAPQLSSEKQLHTLSDSDLLQEIRRYNGTPEAVLNDQELMQLLLPTIRADFAIVETYFYQSEPPLSCPITVLGGTQDQIVQPWELNSWRSQSNTAFEQCLLPGDHFFLHSSQFHLLSLVASRLKT